jgi:hypothetical protein
MSDSDEYEVISLTFFKDWHELTKKYKLSKEQYGKVVYAMCEYSFYNIDTKLDQPESIMFDMSKPYIKASNKKKLAGHNGGFQRKGGAPEGNQNAKKKAQ